MYCTYQDTINTYQDSGREICPIRDSGEAMDDLSIQELNGQVGILCMGENHHSPLPPDIHLQHLKIEEIGEGRL